MNIDHTVNFDINSYLNERNAVGFVVELPAITFKDGVRMSDYLQGVAPEFGIYVCDTREDTMQTYLATDEGASWDRVSEIPPQVMALVEDARVHCLI